MTVNKAIISKVSVLRYIKVCLYVTWAAPLYAERTVNNKSI